MTCAKCNVQTPPNGNFCINCGSPATPQSPYQGLVLGAVLIGGVAGTALFVALFGNIVTGLIGGGIGSSALGLTAFGLAHKA